MIPKRKVRDMDDVELAMMVEKEARRIDEALEEYPESCAVCEEKLRNPHPDDPPICGGDCWDEFFHLTDEVA